MTIGSISDGHIHPEIATIKEQSSDKFRYVIGKLKSVTSDK